MHLSEQLTTAGKANKSPTHSMYTFLALSSSAAPDEVLLGLFVNNDCTSIGNNTRVHLRKAELGDIEKKA